MFSYSFLPLIIFLNSFLSCIVFSGCSFFYLHIYFAALRLPFFHFILYSSLFFFLLFIFHFPSFPFSPSPLVCILPLFVPLLFSFPLHFPSLPFPSLPIIIPFFSSCSFSFPFTFSPFSLFCIFLHHYFPLPFAFLPFLFLYYFLLLFSLFSSFQFPHFTFSFFPLFFFTFLHFPFLHYVLAFFTSSVDFPFFVPFLPFTSLY